MDAFTHGFDLEYRGPWNGQDTARNIPLQLGVLNKTEMWNKIVKEVKTKRYAGPYKEIPFKYFIQSPIGLVPKSGNKTRLIFHLSYDFGGKDEAHRKSVNYHTPVNLWMVKYNDIDCAVKLSLEMLQNIRDRNKTSLKKARLRDSMK